MSAADSMQEANELWARAVLEFQAGAHGKGSAEILRLMRQSLELDDSHADRHYFVGVLLTMRNSVAEAISSFETAVRLQPLSKLAYLELVFLYEAERDQDAIRKVVARAIQAGAYWTNEWQYCPMFTPGITAKPWWDVAEFPWAQELEAAFPEIKAELLALFDANGDSSLTAAEGWARVGEDETTGDATLVAPGGNWRELVIFKAEDEEAGSAGTVQPLHRTRAILEQLLPGAVTLARMGAGEVIFSALAPGTKLLPHCGSNNVRLTCHLGIFCPDGAHIRVGTTWKSWTEGKCLFFDDSFEHEIVHDGDATRVVLLIRFWHPELPPERWQETLDNGYSIFEHLGEKRQTPPVTREVAESMNEQSRQSHAA